MEVLRDEKVRSWPFALIADAAYKDYTNGYPDDSVGKGDQKDHSDCRKWQPP